MAGVAGPEGRGSRAAPSRPARPAAPRSGSVAMFTVRVNLNGRHYTVAANPGQTLLDALRQAAAMIPDLGEQLQRPGLARIRIEDGIATPPTERELLALDVGLLDCGVRLAAEAVPQGDMAISAPA